MLRKEILRFSHLRTEELGGGRLTDFNLSVFAGEIIYLTGIHGSGKHAVRHLLEGTRKMTGGSLTIDERPVTCVCKEQFYRGGIVVIDGLKSLSGNLTVSENFFLLRPYKAGKVLYREKYAVMETREILKEYEIGCDPAEKVQNLTQYGQYLLCIAKAVLSGARLLVVDCLDISLGIRDYQKLAGILRDLREKGISTLVIDNVVNPLLEAADRAVVIYDGRDLKVLDGEQLTAREAAGYLTRAPLEETPEKEAPHPGITGIFDLTRDTRIPFETYMETVLGEAASGRFMACIPENGGELLLHNLTLGDNLLLPSYRRVSGVMGMIPKGVAEYAASQYLKTLGIGKTDIAGLDRLERKILCIRRWILAKPDILAMENPDFGLDSDGQRLVFDNLHEAVRAGIRVYVYANNPHTLHTGCSLILQPGSEPFGNNA